MPIKTARVPDRCILLRRAVLNKDTKNAFVWRVDAGRVVTKQDPWTPRKVAALHENKLPMKLSAFAHQHARRA